MPRKSPTECVHMAEAPSLDLQYHYLERYLDFAERDGDACLHESDGFSVRVRNRPLIKVGRPMQGDKSSPRPSSHSREFSNHYPPGRVQARRYWWIRYKRPTLCAGSKALPSGQTQHSPPLFDFGPPPPPSTSFHHTTTLDTTSISSHNE
ncbi:hypothetical protein EK21DRAFT_90488 [Setomelanomma holmii]|uniref:Uncharacterized protein n=1 Tax=Setomelanomma holmii TaxID=210430 RepID=A0A9P4H6S2_9PLEO|nr:hypothetical protein EK21DRAFT_90488 [Setomelanomma holmii]